MHFSSFVTPFSISTVANQFSLKFNSNSNAVATEPTNANSKSDDNNLLKMNGESIAIAVSRYQNSTSRCSRQNVLNKYYRDNCVQISEDISNNVLSTSLISAKLRGDDNFLGIRYENLQNNLQQLNKHDSSKRSIQNNCIRIQDICSVIKKEGKCIENTSAGTLSTQQNISAASWPSIAAVAAAAASAVAPTPGTSTTVADYLSHLPCSSLPLSLHSLFKYSTENAKNDDLLDCVPNTDQVEIQGASLFNGQNLSKKKKRKKTPKEKKTKLKPKPGEIRMTTALDGSALYCCPECHMAYPDKTLLEQHLLGHTVERRFFCDICGAGLKRKDHLTRHKQSHNPDRPHACSVCTKSFKRKEQLALHYVIHSGEKRHVCTECGKGFYRKDHLRKHTRSHIARRVKAELSQYVPSVGNSASTSAF